MKYIYATIIRFSDGGSQVSEKKSEIKADRITDEKGRKWEWTGKVEDEQGNIWLAEIEKKA